MMKSFSVISKQVCISNINGKLYAIDNVCTHAGGDLSKGKLEGKIVTCPNHGAKFDVTTGKCILGPKMGFLKLKIKDELTYELEIEGVRIKVNL